MSDGKVNEQQEMINDLLLLVDKLITELEIRKEADEVRKDNDDETAIRILEVMERAGSLGLIEKEDNSPVDIFEDSDINIEQDDSGYELGKEENDEPKTDADITPIDEGNIPQTDEDREESFNSVITS